MKRCIVLVCLIISIIFQTCQKKTKQEEQIAVSSDTTQQTATIDNPPAPDFRKEASDTKAMQLADSVMFAMGGRKNWDQTRLVTWNFFGRRSLFWDKYTDDVRIEIPEDSLTIILNLRQAEGKAKKGQQEITQPDSLEKVLAQGRSIWNNDAYWLFMPFKMKDSGVALKYLRSDTTQTGEAADVVELRFENVGDTPQNRYEVYIDKDSKLVSQWAFFKEANQEEPNFITPWQAYEKHGEILLSGDRGQRKISDISVMSDIPEGLFTSLDTPTL